MDKLLRFFVIGCGSIGRRHIKNLLDMGFNDLLVYDVSSERRRQVSSEFNVQSVATLSDGWVLEPNVAFITASTSFHLPLSLEAASNRCHLFIEKPLSDREEGLDELVAIVESYGLRTMVGCNMRFHHGPRTIKELLDKGYIGNIISAHMDAGQYLPDWHPWEDYREMYSAKSALGGGVVLDGIHEIDLAKWMFGEVDRVYSQGGKLSSLEIDTEDTIDILLGMSRGFSVSIHLDYVQRIYARTAKIIGEEGTIFWDISNNEVSLFTANNGGWESYTPVAGYSINQMYVDELAYFTHSLNTGEPNYANINEARRVLEITLAIKQSMINGQSIGVSL